MGLGTLLNAAEALSTDTLSTVAVYPDFLSPTELAKVTFTARRWLQTDRGGSCASDAAEGSGKRPERCSHAMQVGCVLYNRLYTALSASDDGMRSVTESEVQKGVLCDDGDDGDDSVDSDNGDTTVYVSHIFRTTTPHHDHYVHYDKVSLLHVSLGVSCDSIHRSAV
jgi:hypothetical protein